MRNGGGREYRNVGCWTVQLTGMFSNEYERLGSLAYLDRIPYKDTGGRLRANRTEIHENCQVPFCGPVGVSMLKVGTLKRTILWYFITSLHTW